MGVWSTFPEFGGELLIAVYIGRFKISSLTTVKFFRKSDQAFGIYFGNLDDSISSNNLPPWGGATSTMTPWELIFKKTTNPSTSTPDL